MNYKLDSCMTLLEECKIINHKALVFYLGLKAEVCLGFGRPEKNLKNTNSYLKTGDFSRGLIIFIKNIMLEF